MLEGIELFKLSTQRMRYLSDRQALINRNVANADTPGYRAQDLATFQANSPLLRQGGGAGAQPQLAVAQTNAAHLGFGASGTTNAMLDRHAHGYDEKLDFNNVSVEEQMVKANDVANAYDLATTAYKKSMSLLRISIGDGK